MRNQELSTAAKKDRKTAEKARGTGRKARETATGRGDNGPQQAKTGTTAAGRKPKKDRSGKEPEREPARAIVGSSKRHAARRCCGGAVVGTTGSAGHIGTAIGTQVGRQRAVVVSFRSNQAGRRPSFR